MPSSPVARVVSRLRKAVLCRADVSLSDGQLLDRYLEKRDEAAFAALVRRHGPMVWGVCQRIAGDAADAEDAFQAAFLILIRKAAAVKPREAVGNWLYGVARHSALKARTASHRVHAKEKQVTSMPEPATPPRDDREELEQLLDQELSALPDHYRLPVVLCNLEGRTRRDVAAHLKIPEGTLSSRLATAHQMLAKRLARHGLAVTGGSLAALFAQNAVPAAVVCSTIKTATLVAASNGAVAGVVSTKVAALTQGVMKAMLLTKLKAAFGAVLILGFMVTGATGLAYRMAAAQGDQPRNVEELPATPQKQEQIREKEAVTALSKEVDDLQGEWEVVALEEEGEKAAADVLKAMKCVIKGNEIIGVQPALSGRMSFKLNPVKTPKEIDLTALDGNLKGTTEPGIYAIEGSRLCVCWGGKVRPKEFATAPGSGLMMITLEKVAYTAWGKEIGGLQAGLGFKAGEKRAYHHGETVTLVLRVRNIGKEAVEFKHIWAFFVENPPKITDADGKMVKLPNYRTSDQGLHMPRSGNVAPGKEVELYEWTFDLQPNGEDSSRSFIHGTGKHSLQCERILGPTWLNPDHPNPTLNKLATGKLELEIRAKQPVKMPPKDLGKTQPPGGVPLPLVKPGTNEIGVDQLNKVRERLEAVPAEDLEKWVVELERIMGKKLKDGLPSARQVCRTDFAIHLSVAFDDIKWNAKTADNLLQRAQTMPAAEAKAWKEAFESLLKKEIGQTDTEVLAGGPEWAIPLVLIPVDALHQGQKYSAERGKKYRARLKQLTADDVLLWKDKVDNFGGTKLDAAVNIILLDEFFDNETFQRDKFKAAVEARKR